jgi:hypothetical protein
MFHYWIGVFVLLSLENLLINLLPGGRVLSTLIAILHKLGI